MAYASANLYLVDQGMSGNVRRWTYYSDDSLVTILGSGYFSDGVKRGMKVGDLVEVLRGTLNTMLTNSPSTNSMGAVSVFASEPSTIRCAVSAVSGDAATVQAHPEVVGASSASTVGFYGATPITQPAASAQGLVTSASATSNTPWGYGTAAQADGVITLLREIRNVLVNLGLMKGGA